MAAEVYVSVDVESDGPIPGPNSMLSIGAVAFTLDRTELSSFTRNLETLPGAVGAADTMAWWAQPEQQAAWAQHRQDLHTPACAMLEFVAWVKALPGKPVFVAYPAGYDWIWGYWYMLKFAGESPFGFSGVIDIKSYAMAVMKKPFHECTKKNMLREWIPEEKHTHVAVEDAREQGILFLNMLHYNLGAKNA